MSMLHSLAAERSRREIWWIYGARHRVEHPFAEESRSLLKQFSRGRGYIVYSRPATTDRVGADFDAPGTLTQLCWRELACPRVATSICVPPHHSCRICGTGCKRGAYPPGMCTRKSSV